MSVDVITQVAFITGRILHRGTGEPVIGEIEITAREGPVVVGVLADGTFIISGHLQSLFPNLANQDYELRLKIRAYSAQFRGGVIDHQLTVTIPSGSNFDPDPPAVPDALKDAGAIFLPADPINIRGRVVEAINPDVPIPDARIDVLHGGLPIPFVTTDADGRYRFENIEVTAPVQISCSKPASFKTQTRKLLIDFSRLVNDEYFRLPPL